MEPIPNPPRWADRLLEYFVSNHLLEDVQGDLYEIYQRRAKMVGIAKARREYGWNAVRYVNPFFRKQKSGHYTQPLFSATMIRNYVKIAVRGLLRHKSYAFINIAGLALGLAATIVILLIVRNELTYDSFHAKADRTYRVTVRALDYNPSVSFAIAPALRNDFPEAENISQFWHWQEGMIKIGSERYSEKALAFADDQFVQVFNFDWVEGNPKTALQAPNSIVLTESAAQKYFGKEDPIGKTIQLENRWDLRVTGVMKDLPSNTHFSFRFLISWATIQKDAEKSPFWNIQGGFTYVTLPEKIAAQKVEALLPAFVDKNWGKDIAKEARLLLQPLQEIHYDKRYMTHIVKTRTKESIYGLLGVAVFIILSACINFVNLATAQAIRRAKEVGVRKTMGAYRRQLIGQMLGETSTLVFVAVMVAMVLISFFIPVSESLLDIRLSSTQIMEPDVLGIIAGIVLLTILLAGLYPALIQSGFEPVQALKSKITDQSVGGVGLRKGLVVMQFVITQAIIIATLVVASQMDFFLNQDLGFTKDAVISFPVGQKREVLLQKLANNPGVQQVSLASAGPAYNSSFAPFIAPEFGVTENQVTELKRIDENYMDMFQLKLLAGEPIRKINGEDSIKRIVVNQALIRKLGIFDPQKAIGKQIRGAGDPCVIIGVVKDFQSESKHALIRPCILSYNPKSFWQANVKLRPERMHETLASIEADWTALNPESLFTYEFLDEHIAKKYAQEQNVYNAFRLFATIAILIGCLGLYGLVSLMTVQKTKEVGIRKVLGASVSSIVLLFSRQFIWLVLIAFVIAGPLVWYFMNQWLQEFAYHIQLGPVIFLISLILTILIAALTIGYQSIKAALANPIKSLRSE
ncbi:ABC transporter permease [Xanthocytophaga flava]|uniref:ABC transporter permease n=1 Tax=Xanthocytophaga flava TaxID=3048013 RepID=UPI0028D250C3|nr:ABC transporter permease [Xanthocytophaga flavus]MDJ1471792.1 ABC transporter permease [Xanthocytophaga flavus]